MTQKTEGLQKSDTGLDVDSDKIPNEIIALRPEQ